MFMRMWPAVIVFASLVLPAEEKPVPLPAPKEVAPKFFIEKITSRQKAKDALQKLKNAVRYHDYRYYTLNDPVISDAEYDGLKKQIRKLEEKFPSLQNLQSPTQNVSRPLLDQLKAVKHFKPMLSLTKAKNEQDLQDFIQRCMKTLQVETIAFLVEPKYDGLGIEVFYKKGKLKTAATRGDGILGENVTKNVEQIVDVPKQLKGDAVPEIVIVRGEVFMEKKTFSRLNESRLKAGISLFANPRNAASGSLRQSDPATTKNRNLRMIAYEWVNAKECGKKSHWESLQALRSYGFNINENEITKCKTFQQVLDRKDNWQKRRSELPYEMDGLVVKVDRLAYRKIVGEGTAGPNWAVALKFPALRKSTTLLKIDVQVGRSGVLTPVAVFQPIVLGGSTFSKATLHNWEIVKQLNLVIGGRILVERAGDVIPRIIKSMPNDSEKETQKIIIPVVCPECSKSVVPKEKFIFCLNHSCPAKLKARVAHFASRNAMNIKGLGKKTIGILVEQKLIKRLPDLFFIQKKDLLKLKGFGNKSTDKLLTAINASKQNTLSRFIYGLGISGVGKKSAEKLCRKFKDLQSVKNADKNKLDKVVGKTAVENLGNFFHEETTKELLKDFQAAGLNLQNPLFENREGRSN